jgi:hypothetical protein
MGAALAERALSVKPASRQHFAVLGPEVNELFAVRLHVVGLLRGISRRPLQADCSCLTLRVSPVFDARDTTPGIAACLIVETIERQVPRPSQMWGRQYVAVCEDELSISPNESRKVDVLSRARLFDANIASGRLAKRIALTSGTHPMESCQKLHARLAGGDLHEHRTGDLTW